MSLQAAREKLDSTRDNAAHLELENRVLADKLVGGWVGGWVEAQGDASQQVSRVHSERGLHVTHPPGILCLTPAGC
jgi:hypothetical protein